MQVSYNSRNDVDREEAEFALGKNNMFLDDNKKKIEQILLDKEEEIMNKKGPLENEKKEILERIPNMKRKNTKSHSHIIEKVVGLKKTDLKNQKSGSVTIPSALEIPIGKFLLKKDDGFF